MDNINIIDAIIPIWLVLIVIEIIVTLFKKESWYRINDTINNLSLGGLYTLSNVITKGILIAIYTVFYQYSPFNLQDHPWLLWITAFILYDLCYYCNHRLGHEINILWASHSVHHQSEEYNLSVALRQTSTSFIFSWVFYLPMALLGIPPIVFLIVGGLNLSYQFWIHTRHIPKLGLIEKILVTPSSHRVHHATNPIYLDKNYGGCFILWDRLFGSYQEELSSEPAIYGISQPLRSWNPLWANVAIYTQLFDDAKKTQHWRDKITIWFKKTGWRPADVKTKYPVKEHHKKHAMYDAKPGPLMSGYIVVQFLFYAISTFVFLSIAATQNNTFNLLIVVIFTIQAVLIGLLMENAYKSILIEIPRLVTILIMSHIASMNNLLTKNLETIIILFVCLSIFIVFFIDQDKDNKTEETVYKIDKS